MPLSTDFLEIECKQTTQLHKSNQTNELKVLKTNNVGFQNNHCFMNHLTVTIGKN